MRDYTWRMATVTTNSILTAEEVAELLGCSITTIEEKARKGELPGLLYGDGGWVFPGEALLTHVNRLALEQMHKRGAPPKVSATSVQPIPKRKGPVVLPSLG